jgi:3-isopropylmalate/(R)-2-methylmalate dehydratase small subunit
MKELSRYLFEDIRPGFYKEITSQKSIIVGGANFGMGSSREQAPWVIKEAGIKCVIAVNFARIFYRNAFNIGLPLIEADIKSLRESDSITINFDRGTIEKTDADRKIINFTPFNKFRKELIANGGIITYLKKYGDFKLD